MQLEPEEPIDRGFASCGKSLKHPMRMDATVVTHLQTGRVEKADATAGAKAVLEIGAQWQQDRGHPTDKAAVAHQLGKRSWPVHAHMIQVIVLEGAIVSLMKANQNRHHLAQAQVALTIALL